MTSSPKTRPPTPSPFAIFDTAAVMDPREPILLDGKERSALILYGSETGNAQDVAEELGRLCERLRFATNVCALDDIDLVRLHGTRESVYDCSNWCPSSIGSISAD
jgi:hypothetical protein